MNNSKQYRQKKRFWLSLLLGGVVGNFILLGLTPTTLLTYATIYTGFLVGFLVALGGLFQKGNPYFRGGLLGILATIPLGFTLLALPDYNFQGLQILFVVLVVLTGGLVGLCVDVITTKWAEA